MAYHLVESVGRLVLPPAAKLLMVCFAESAHKEDRLSWPGMEKQREWTGLQDRGIYKLQRQLVAGDYMVRLQPGANRTRALWCVMPLGCCDHHRGPPDLDVIRQSPLSPETRMRAMRILRQYLPDNHAHPVRQDTVNPVPQDTLDYRSSLSPRTVHPVPQDSSPCPPGHPFRKNTDNTGRGSPLPVGHQRDEPELPPPWWAEARRAGGRS